MKKNNGEQGFSEKQKNIAFFLAKFFFIFLVFQFLILAIDLSVLENALAQLEGSWIRAPVFENQIQIGKGIFFITPNCTGLLSAIILAGVVFGLKKPGWKTKLLIWLMGSVVLFLLNIGRVFLVLWIGKTAGLQAAELAHQVSWFCTTLFILGVWLLLAQKIAKVKHVSELAQ